MDFENLGKALLTTSAFSLVGIVMFALAFFLMEKLTPFSIRKEIEEDENDALAMIMSAIIIGIALDHHGRAARLSASSSRHFPWPLAVRRSSTSTSSSWVRAG